MECRNENSIDVNFLRHEVKKICRELYYKEHYSPGEPSLIAEGINLVYKVLEHVTGIEYGWLADD